MEDEPVKFRCEECGEEFDPDPDCMLELHWGAVLEGDDPPGAVEMTTEDFEKMDAEELREIGLTPEQREQMLAGEEVTGGGICICKECQDRLAEEQTSGAEE